MPTTTADTLQTLAEAIDAIAGARSPDDVQRVVPPAAQRLTAADGAALVLREDGGWSSVQREPVAVEDVHADARIPGGAYHENVRSLLVVPIGTGDTLGAIETHWEQRHEASGEEIALLRSLAGSTAVALERARLAQEIERRRITEEDLRRLSERDPLTGVLNRRAWDQLLTSALRKGTQPLFVALLDLDHFKSYNDRYGHCAGDELLRRAARSWRSAIRAGDVLARYGGEEFAVLLAGCEEARAVEIAERLRRAMLDEQPVSIGLARWDGSEDAGNLTERADRALYEAKRTGRNRVAMAGSGAPAA
jgi:diguanylate cyclase (GGDEF)-like protein